MRYLINCVTIFFFVASATAAFEDHDSDTSAMPTVPDGFKIELIASEPFVSNPCAMAFDVQGRICVGMGPQYRKPTRETPGDSVWILTDSNGDGRLDKKHQYATGFNCIQSLAWHGNDLWIANAPDLTVVRDTDGDEVADEYIRVYTDLGNLEHGLHGLTWGPDGRLYMSKGNSKGHTRTDHLAPKPFRDLWGVTAPKGSPDFPPIVRSGAEDYARAFHNPKDDWGREGGVLVCDRMGKNLEIVSRGFRNPWDIAHDDEFHWLGTDNDQDEGDRIFAPFRNSHYGWGHPWSAHWTGENHLPTAPISGPVFHGSGTGITFYNAKQFPPSHRKVWFFNDWLNQTTYMYRVKWDGALPQPVDGTWTEFIVGGKALFRPTDIDVGPDGALYVMGWGREYGVQWNDAKEQVNEGRIYRVTWAQSSHSNDDELNWNQPLKEWTLRSLFNAFSSPVAARRIVAQHEILRRCKTHRESDREIVDQIERHCHGGPTRQIETWLIGTLAQIESKESSQLLRDFCNSAQPNHRLQALRGLALQAVRGAVPPSAVQQAIRKSLQNSDPKERSIAISAIHPNWLKRATAAERTRMVDTLIQSCANETDRVCFYKLWQSLREITAAEQRTSLLENEKAGVRLAAVLSLTEDRQLAEDRARELLRDDDERVREIAAMWLTKRGGSGLMAIRPTSQDFDTDLTIRINSRIKPARLFYTTDGTEPTQASRRWDGLTIDESTTLKVAMYSDGRRIGRVAEMNYRQRAGTAALARVGLLNVRAESGNAYRPEFGGFANGKRVYSDRKFVYESIPDDLQGLTCIKCSNEDAGSHGTDFLRFESVVPLTIYLGHDQRIADDPEWINGFETTRMQVKTDDATFDIYRRDFPAGEITLGGNSVDRDDGGKSNYLVAIRQHGLQLLPADKPAATVDDVMKRLEKANAKRGQALFFAEGAAACSTCHPADGKSENGYGPDLLNLVKRNDPAYIARSMLEPSAHITEGYQLQFIETDDGKQISGLLRKQTDDGITLAQPDRTTVFVPAEKIETRTSGKKSPMPEFDRLLNAQQVADITRWLVSRHDLAQVAQASSANQVAANEDDKISAAADIKHTQTATVSKPSSVRTATLDPDSAKFAFNVTKDRVDVTLNDHPFGTYLFRHNEMTRPGWVHMRTHNGLQITRDFPATEDNDDHKFMHPGIWISFGHLDGEDYWRMKSPTQHIGFLKTPRANGATGSFTVKNRYYRSDRQRSVCNEITRYDLVATAEGVVMNVDATFSKASADFYFGDQEESGLAFRLPSSLRAEGGSGTILNSQGDRNEDEVRGKQTKWIDYSGPLTIGNVTRHVGIMVVPHPENARESWMHARDYGYVAVNPFPRQPKGQRDPVVKTWVKKGDSYRLRYTVLIHDTSEGIDHKAIHRRLSLRR